MIKAVFYENADRGFTGFEVKGHAGYAEYGQDIICAAVSALAITTINSIEAFTEAAFQIRQDEKTGLLALTFQSEPGPEAALLLNSLRLGLTGIQNEENNTEYLSVRTEEV